ncbi:MAG: hypothetical protein IH595_00850 [Bacteroidales bacterium]|nr:hypothetical protein [Bacteroidales bacterium]
MPKYLIKIFSSLLLGIKVHTKRNLFVVLPLILLAGCSKNEKLMPTAYLKPYYISNWIVPDTTNHYDGEYYIHVKYKGLSTAQNNLDSGELTFNQVYQSMQVRNSPAHEWDTNIIYEGTSFLDLKTYDMLSVYFYCDLTYSNNFKLAYANYSYSNMSAGANIIFDKVVERGLGWNSYDEFKGANSSKGYFLITYIGKNRINGIFKTIWKGTYGSEKSYSVEGDFSVPPVEFVSE